MVVFRLSDGKVWNPTAGTPAFETFSAGSITDYDIALTNVAADLWTGDFPTGISNGTVCRVFYYERTGASPSVSDLVLKAPQFTAGQAPQTSASGEDLTTLANLKVYLGIASSVTTYDTLFSALITAASLALAHFCDRDSFKATAYTSTLNGNGHRYYVLPNTPINSITSVVMDYNETTTDTYLGTSFDYEPNTGKVLFKPTATKTRRFPYGFRNLYWVYNSGYATIPADLELICQMVVATMWRRSTSNATGGVASEKIGDYAISYFNPMLLSSMFASDPAFDQVRTLCYCGGYKKIPVTFD